MKTINKYIVLIFLFALFSCSSSKSKVTPLQLNRLAQLVQDRHFEINSDIAYPQVTTAMISLQTSGLIPPGSSINQISLIGNDNYIKIIGDSIYAELPYFGERQMSSSYNGSDTSISIKDVLQNYSVKENYKDDSYTISCKAKTQKELLKLNIIIFPNLKTTMVVSGPTRSTIRYSGIAIELTK